jgi:hypothetical protein
MKQWEKSLWHTSIIDLPMELMSIVSSGLQELVLCSEMDLVAFVYIVMCLKKKNYQ